VLTRILFVLRSGIPWRMLRLEMGCGSGVTCWRRLREWQRRGVWKRLHRALLEDLAAADRIDWSRAALDSRSLPAKKGGARSGGTPRTRANRARSSLVWSTGPGSRSPAQ
jgi:transposase